MNIKNLSDFLTVVIKTIHRPWCCARLIQSVDRHIPGVPIHVLDDGQPDRRLSATFKNEANRVNKLIETAFDIGISAGRNQLLSTVDTPFFLLLDDDHVITSQSHVATLVSQLANYGRECDLLAAKSNDSGKPRCFRVDDENRVLRAEARFHRRDGHVYFCDMVPNTFVAKTEVVRDIGWDESLKLHEHWEFFYRAWMNGLRVAISHDHRFDHKHVYRTDYQKLRNRSWYLEKGLRKHGLRRFMWTSPMKETES